MKRQTLMFPLLLALLLTAGWSPVFAQQGDTATDKELDELREDITVANAQWARAFRTSDANAVAQLFDERGALLGQEGSITFGRPEIEKAMQRWMKAIGSAQVTLASESLWRIGEMAWEAGTFDYQWYTAGSNNTMTSHGSYVSQWRQQADGSWKIYRSIPLPE